jgi:hypothetical protein
VDMCLFGDVKAAGNLQDRINVLVADLRGHK